MLVDVRTRAEWSFVGVPDLRGQGKDVLLVEWQGFPAGTPVPDFVATLSEQLGTRGLGPDTPIYFLCRSGVRSLHAAVAMTEAGYRACYNIAGGFEGPLDEAGHRGRLGGWKAVGLPWVQS
ncbi:Putative rhodanese-like sulfurtransferase [Polymorphum gilvum SL003B-26A1]|uniref:Putative rhodanese-like sulfurtransferase n=2 Tax=Polymorphum TaxID=991903 RepID=F2IVN3_POLGS|nr:Putative rhodanese-like sulfurtransferase [Polymorphum gilvum SL003B-26A1]